MDNRKYYILSDIFKRFIEWTKGHHVIPRLMFLVSGIISTIWVLIRVIPEPSRSSYPCVRAAAPLMSGFLIYLFGLGSVAFSLRKTSHYFRQTRYIPALSFLFAAIAGLLITIPNGSLDTYALNRELTGTDDGPNQPAGKGTGINPGRVIWVWDSAATNENCKNDFDSHNWIWKPRSTNEVINSSRMPGFFDYPSPAAPSVLRKEGAAVCWKRWRLLENRELYNLEDDPMQEQNVIEKYPEIAAKMRKHLDKWWNSVGNSANELQRVIIGSDEENPVMLTACDWPDVFVDMQAQVRSGVRKNGYWLLQVEKPGKYEFELRRWPGEANTPLSESEKNFKKLPIASARIYIDFNTSSDSPVKNPAITQSVEVTPEDSAAVFTFDLEKGPATLHTWFNDMEQQRLCGAYYVYVKRL